MKEIFTSLVISNWIIRTSYQSVIIIIYNDILYGKSRNTVRNSTSLGILILSFVFESVC